MAVLESWIQSTVTLSLNSDCAPSVCVPHVCFCCWCVSRACSQFSPPILLWPTQTSTSPGPGVPSPVPREAQPGPSNTRPADVGHLYGRGGRQGEEPGRAGEERLGRGMGYFQLVITGCDDGDSSQLFLVPKVVSFAHKGKDEGRSLELFLTNRLLEPNDLVLSALCKVFFFEWKMIQPNY